MTTVKQMYSAYEIADRIDVLAAEIAAEISSHLTVIGVLKGSFIFLADLVRALDRAGLPCRVEFLSLSSYGNKQKASGDVVLIGGYPDVDSDGTILLVDDIVDTGNSITYAINLLKAGSTMKIKRAHCWISRQDGKWMWMWVLLALPSPTNLLLDMASIMPKTTGLYLI